MSPLHPLLEKQRKKVQREQRGWILIAVGIGLMYVIEWRIIRVVMQPISINPMPSTLAPYFGLGMADVAAWWIPCLCAWVLVTLACQLRGLATFHGEGILLLAIAWTITTVDLAMCVYLILLL